MAYTEFEKLAGVNSPETEEMFAKEIEKVAWIDTMIKIAQANGETISPQDLGLTDAEAATAAVVEATEKALKQQGVDPDQVVDAIAENIADDPQATANFFGAENMNDLGSAVVENLAEQNG